MSNLENLIKNWKKILHKNPSLEEGYIEELESHLRDEIDNFINKGMKEEKAFNEACNKIGVGNKISEEYRKTDYSLNSNKILWNESSNYLILIANYFKIAFRMLRKQSLGPKELYFSALAIIGKH